jgi:hypothetical protein
MDEHAATKDAKCKKCKKIFEICQAGYHGPDDGSPEGWRICYVPCHCGSQHYPDKAKAARPLAPHEYVPEHPGYRPLEPDPSESDDFDNTSVYPETTGIPLYSSIDSTSIDPDTTDVHDNIAGPSSSSHQRTFSEDSIDPLQWSPGRIERESQGVAVVTQQFDQLQMGDDDSSQSPIYVDTQVSKHGLVSFTNPDGREIKVKQDKWIPGEIEYEGQLVPCLKYVGPSSGRHYYTWTFDNQEKKGSRSGRQRRR